MQPPLLNRVQRALDLLLCPWEYRGEESRHDEDGYCGPDVPDCGPGDCGHAEEGGEIGDGEEESGDCGEEGGGVGLDGVGDVEFEFDEVVEAWELSVSKNERQDLGWLTIFEAVKCALKLFEIFHSVVHVCPQRIFLLVLRDILFQLLELLVSSHMEV